MMLGAPGARWCATAAGDALHSYAAYKQTPVSLRQLVEFGRTRSVETALQSCRFLRSELPVRLAHMTMEINSLPGRLLSMPAVERVRSWYVMSFGDLLSFPEGPAPGEAPALYVKRFSALLQNILRRHEPVVMTLAQGIMEYKRLHGVAALDNSVQFFLDRFYLSRIGIRMLMSQHTELFAEPAEQPRAAEDGNWVGVIDLQCAIRRIAESAAADAASLCERYFRIAPEVRILLPGAVRRGQTELHFPYIPSHLHHILFELLKNSMRATVEAHAAPAPAALPPIRVIAVKGDEDVTIQIADEGGGIPRSGMRMLFSYFYTTASVPDEPVTRDTVPMAGFGCGIPLSRLYARYFGGDLDILSMDGYGTSA